MPITLQFKGLKKLPPSSKFKQKPIPWMYSRVGSMLATAFIKLNPIHRRLTELEIKNIQDYFNSDLISPENRRRLSRMAAFFMTYFHAIQRLTGISKLARQDYYALQRQGCFAVRELPPITIYPKSPYLPVLIVPGLNTPPAFFREMYSYFFSRGYNVSVMELPENGFANIEASALALKQEVENLMERCNAPKVNIIGHCLGGLVAHYWFENLDAQKPQASIQNLISLGTGFLGAEGVRQLKNLWIPRNPGKPVPAVFDELIQANWKAVRRSTEVACHNILTIWDFMVHFRKGLLQSPKEHPQMVVNHIIEDPAIDHLTIALHHGVFARIESILRASTQQPQATSGIL
ncbi:MAG TPA: alpha/beta fold hydrolase [Oculatellaceae cyanobacterium]|jgi:pimeloyl-ACP methyl ester carboxylesterase